MTRPRYLGIEIGGTKLQLGVGYQDSPELLEIVREPVNVDAGAEGILEAIRTLAPPMRSKYDIHGVGIGFGGPVNRSAGTTTKSHQIQGWEQVPLCNLVAQWLGVPASVDNDCNVAALAEANLGAGQGAGRVFYVTVGTGVGGGFVIDGCLDGNDRPAIAEIGHLRPGLAATCPSDTVESMASGWGIANWAKEAVLSDGDEAAAEALLNYCGGDIRELTTKLIGQAAEHGNVLAIQAIARCTRALGWAIAQTLTLLAPQKVVIGGGVSLIGQEFLEQLRLETSKYLFPPLEAHYEILPAALGEEVVLYGAIQIAPQA